MAGPFTEPRDLRPREEADPPLRRRRDDPPLESPATGHSERETHLHGKAAHEDTVTKTSRVYFFIMAAIIALAIAVFLILRPQAGD